MKRGLWVWLVAAGGLVMAVNTGANIWRLWKLGGSVTTAQREVDSAAALNGQLKSQLQYVQSPEFVEKEARDKLGYGKAGETIVVVPEQEQNSNFQITNSQKSEPNWKQWLSLYIWPGGGR